MKRLLHHARRSGHAPTALGTLALDRRILRDIGLEHLAEPAIGFAVRPLDTLR